MFSFISMAFNTIYVPTVPKFLPISLHVLPNFSHLFPIDYISIWMSHRQVKLNILKLKNFTSFLHFLLCNISLPQTFPISTNDTMSTHCLKEKSRSHPITSKSCWMYLQNISWIYPLLSTLVHIASILLPALLMHPLICFLCFLW